MSLTLTYDRITLQFTFRAGTSRGVMTEKVSWIIRVSHDQAEGYGEAGPLPGLSVDTGLDMEAALNVLSEQLSQLTLPRSEQGCLELAHTLCHEDWHALRFALESALIDLLNGGRRVLFNTSFTRGDHPIPINGLIWMGSPDFMRQQIRQKLDQGFSCLKMKIGAIDFDEELLLLREIRKEFHGILRVDANGAFDPAEAEGRLRQLAEFDLHSIEQPIHAGQAEAMARLCAHARVPVALDEELIGVPQEEAGRMLEQIRPQFIILKPTLLGGIARTRHWIRLAEALDIGWWITSALESNIGLNVISQLTASMNYQGHQGLGTGNLYQKNFDSPLSLYEGYMYFDPKKEWVIHPDEL